jgi:hypothetical protein
LFSEWTDADRGPRLVCDLFLALPIWYDHFAISMNWPYQKKPFSGFPRGRTGE